mgnify:CR=1 FL=1
MIRITEIKVEETYPIRKSVLREGMTLSHEMNADHDADTLHLGLFDKEQLVCVGSFMKASNADFKGVQYQLRGMASAKGCQGKGYGKKLLEAAEQLLKEGRLNNASAMIAVQWLMLNRSDLQKRWKVHVEC